MDKVACPQPWLWRPSFHSIALSPAWSPTFFCCLPGTNVWPATNRQGERASGLQRQASWGIMRPQLCQEAKVKPMSVGRVVKDLYSTGRSTSRCRLSQNHEPRRDQAGMTCHMYAIRKSVCFDRWQDPFGVRISGIGAGRRQRRLGDDFPMVGADGVNCGPGSFQCHLLRRNETPSEWTLRVVRTTSAFRYHLQRRAADWRLAHKSRASGGRCRVSCLAAPGGPGADTGCRG